MHLSTIGVVAYNECTRPSFDGEEGRSSHRESTMFATDRLKHECSTPSSRLVGVAVVLFATLLFAPSPAAAQRTKTRSAKYLLIVHQKRHRELQAELTTSLEKLAISCDAKGLSAAATQIRSLAAPIDAQQVRIDSLPKTVQPELPANLPADERYWRTQLQRLQAEYAKDVYLLSRRVLNAGLPSYAFFLIREVAVRDPDHKSARRLLGQVRFGKEWITPFARSMLAKRYIWHEKFGWLPKNRVERYDKGERYFKGRWISATQEAEVRRDFKNAWEIRTDHFLVRTNHSHEEGVAIAKKLEAYHGFFFQTFASFFNTPEQMQKLFAGSTSGMRAPIQAQPHVVHYYSNRDEYNRALVKTIPQIAITNGLYYTTDRTAYFYHDPNGENDPTLYHEASHQLFYESQSKERMVAGDDHFWIIEGISCYLESFRPEKDRITVGDPKYIRFHAARHRFLVDKYYIPLGKLSAMSMRDFQSHPNISRNYSQASGLAHFFMNYDNGRYRDALIEHLSQLYIGSKRRRAQTLAELTGSSYEELDRQYGEHLRAMQTAIDKERQQPQRQQPQR